MLKRVRFPFTTIVVFSFLITMLASVSTNAQGRQPTSTTTSTSQTDALKALQWRSIGPFRGGRVTAVAGRRFAADGLLLRRDGRWRLEDDRRRHQLGSRSAMVQCSAPVRSAR